MSISSDEGKTPKVIHVTQSSGKTKGGKKAKMQSNLSAEELKQVRKDNAKVAKACKKHQDKLESLLKLCNKASKSCHAPESFKQEISAAKDVLKDCKKIQDQVKDRTEETLTFQHEGHIEELMTSLEKHMKCIDTLKSLTDGGMNPEDIEKIMAAAKEKKEKQAAAVNVD